MPKITSFEKNFDLYEAWFENNQYVYKSELKAVKEFIPQSGEGIEIGIGTGRFAIPFNIKQGIEPSKEMAKIANEKGIEIISGVAENLPIDDNSFDFVLMITTICFVDNVKKSLSEIYRILKSTGKVIIGFVDKNTKLGEIYIKNKEKSKFYKEATFFSTDEITSYLNGTGFNNLKYNQTVFGLLNEITEEQDVKQGYGEGSFVVISGEK